MGPSTYDFKNKRGEPIEKPKNTKRPKWTKKKCPEEHETENVREGKWWYKMWERVSGQNFRVIFNVQKDYKLLSVCICSAGFLSNYEPKYTGAAHGYAFRFRIELHILLRYTSVSSHPLPLSLSLFLSGGTISVPAVIPNEKFDTRNVHATNFSRGAVSFSMPPSKNSPNSQKIEITFKKML